MEKKEKLEKEKIHVPSKEHMSWCLLCQLLYRYGDLYE